ncbi:hypothetical protein OBBRIDRAFT_827520 [Obba rivulosa]|uniref:Uncharacterized protein n=1 Tax=Obba rivulosa TaxID=1052685 RepID=A0A8E2DMB5_9APHY|nr:hypothetical protein OBBRIDRAFT_827520 [Obba rivulosa]
MSSSPVWTYARLDDLDSLPADLRNRFHGQLQYLQDLRNSWKVLELPRSWVDESPEYPHAILFDGFNSLLGRLYMKYIEGHLVTQVLEYEGDEFYAENALAMALDGIPNTIVRRSNIRISQIQEQGRTYESVLSGSPKLNDIDFAVLHTPFGASQSASVRRFRRLPISPVNPALALCVRRSGAWKAHCQQEPRLESVIHCLARTAAHSLPSLHAIWTRRTQCKLNRPEGHAPWETNSETGELPPWAVLIGIIYDHEMIHFVAHVPCGSNDPAAQPHHLSVHFESLPVPARGLKDVDQQFLCDRYRAAIALLCLQQHIYRLTSLWDGVRETKEVYEVYAIHLRSLDKKIERGTPTPSELYPGEEEFSDDDLIIDYDEDADGGAPEVPSEDIEKWRNEVETDAQTLVQTLWDYDFGDSGYLPKQRGSIAPDPCAGKCNGGSGGSPGRGAATRYIACGQGYTMGKVDVAESATSHADPPPSQCSSRLQLL